MKILADESVDAPVVEALRKAGHDAEFVLEISPGISDADVLQVANKGKETRLPRNLGGVVFSRLKQITPAVKISPLQAIQQRFFLISKATTIVPKI